MSFTCKQHRKNKTANRINHSQFVFNAVNIKYKFDETLSRTLRLLAIPQSKPISILQLNLQLSSKTRSPTSFDHSLPIFAVSMTVLTLVLISVPTLFILPWCISNSSCLKSLNSSLFRRNEIASAHAALLCDIVMWQKLFGHIIFTSTVTSCHSTNRSLNRSSDSASYDVQRIISRNQLFGCLTELLAVWFYWIDVVLLIAINELWSAIMLLVNDSTKNKSERRVSNRNRIKCDNILQRRWRT